MLGTGGDAVSGGPGRDGFMNLEDRASGGAPSTGEGRSLGNDRSGGEGLPAGDGGPAGEGRAAREGRAAVAAGAAGESGAAREGRAAIDAGSNGAAAAGRGCGAVTAGANGAAAAGRAVAGDRPAGGTPRTSPVGGPGSTQRDGDAGPVGGPDSVPGASAGRTAAGGRPAGVPPEMGRAVVRDRPARASRPPQHGVRRPKRTLAALALGLCAAGLAIGSGADFTARTANPSNVFSAGSLSMENSKDGTAIFTPTGMIPGAAAKTGIVDIKNTGAIAGRFTLSRDQLTNTDLNNDNPIQFAAKVVVGVVDCGQFTTVNGAYGPDPVTPTCGDADDRTVSLGPLSIQNGEIELGTYSAGEKHRYQFSAYLDDSAGNEFAGDSATARYVFDAKQTH